MRNDPFWNQLLADAPGVRDRVRQANLEAFEGILEDLAWPNEQDALADADSIPEREEATSS